jgi:predicted transcriptional regulator
MGIVVFRMVMVLTALRILETGDFSSEIICEQQDFETALKIAEVLLIHAAHVFTQLPAPVVLNQKNNRKERFLELLPQSFNRQGYIKIAEELNIPDKTAQAYITALIKDGKIERDKQDDYKKKD